MPQEFGLKITMLHNVLNVKNITYIIFFEPKHQDYPVCHQLILLCIHMSFQFTLDLQFLFSFLSFPWGV